jgi:hypothetical protein
MKMTKRRVKRRVEGRQVPAVTENRQRAEIAVARRDGQAVQAQQRGGGTPPKERRRKKKTRRVRRRLSI